MRYSDIQLLNEKHWKKRSSSSSSSNFKDKKHNHNSYNRHEPEHDGSVPHRDSHKRHKRRIKQRKQHNQHNQHNNHEHNKGRHFNKKRRNSISINLNTPRVQYRRPLPRTSSTTTTERVPQEWDGNQWVDANSTEFVTTPTQSRRDNTSSEKLDWDGGEWNADAGVTMSDLNAADDTQRMMHQNYELNQFNKRQKK